MSKLHQIHLLKSFASAELKITRFVELRVHRVRSDTCQIFAKKIYSKIPASERE